MVTFTLNGTEYEVEKGSTILDVTRKFGIRVPTLCHHEDLTPYGSCRLCLVEVVRNNWPSIQPACLYPAREGIAVTTDSERVVKTRKVMLELYLARSPNNSRIKELAHEFGVTETRFDLPDTSDCILCGLCVRACEQISERHAISFAQRGSRRTIQTPFDDISEKCVGCKACAFVCPTHTIEIEEAD